MKKTVKAFAVLDPDGSIALSGLSQQYQIFTSDDNNGARAGFPGADVVEVEITYQA